MAAVRKIDVPPPAAIACAGGACQTAVERAYRGMLVADACESSAFAAAVRVLRHHHPELETCEAAATVEYWLRPTVLQ